MIFKINFLTKDFNFDIEHVISLLYFHVYCCSLSEVVRKRTIIIHVCKNDCEISTFVLTFLQKMLPPLRHCYVIPFIPSGFWPRLISRLLTDPSIVYLATEGCGLTEDGKRFQVMENISILLGVYSLRLFKLTTFSDETTERSTFTLSHYKRPLNPISK